MAPEPTDQDRKTAAVFPASLCPPQLSLLTHRCNISTNGGPCRRLSLFHATKCDTSRSSQIEQEAQAGGIGIGHRREEVGVLFRGSGLGAHPSLFFLSLHLFPFCGKALFY